MEVTKELVQAQIDDYNRQLSQAQGQVVLLNGAIQDAQYWLNKLDEEPPAEPTTEPEKLP